MTRSRGDTGSSNSTRPSATPTARPRVPLAKVSPPRAALSSVAPKDGFEGGGASAGATPVATNIQIRLQRMTRAQKIETLMMAYGDVNEPPRSGAIIVNQTHLSAGRFRQLEKNLATAAARTGFPVLVGADQEGGNVNRLGRFAPTAGLYFPSAKQMQGMSLAQIRAEGQKTGRALALAKVNTLLGPSLDVAEKGSLMDRMGRSFGTTPAKVSARAGAFIEGLRQANPNLLIFAKHYPGYNVRVNSDIARAVDDSTPEQLAKRSQPFLDAKGLDGVMVSSIIYSKLDNQPACFSRKIIASIRARHPNAVVITDDLCATALSPHRTTAEIKQNAQRAFLAGCDVLLSLDGSKNRAVTEAIDELITQYPKLQKQLDASVARILALSEKTRARPAPIPVA